MSMLHTITTDVRNPVVPVDTQAAHHFMSHCSACDLTHHEYREHALKRGLYVYGRAEYLQHGRDMYDSMIADMQEH
jgi:hypothetical protein